MTTKHQADCYRTINGQKYVNYCDILCDEHEAEVAALKAAGKRIAKRKHPAGYHQAFIHADDI
jgi:hypothetical protein